MLVIVHQDRGSASRALIFRKAATNRRASGVPVDCQRSRSTIRNIPGGTLLWCDRGDVETALGLGAYPSRCRSASVQWDIGAARLGSSTGRRRSRRIGKLTVEDKRRYPRAEVDAPAHVSFGGTSLSCTVRNISEEGAAIDVDNASYIPERFRLVILPGAAVRDCRLVWIKQNRIGVAFET